MGTVPPEEHSLLKDEIARRLSRLVDPATGERAVTEVFVRDDAYQDAGARELGPDLVIGFAKGIRASDGTVEGRVSREVWEDNAAKWSGDHIMHPDAVPGVLFSTRPLRRPVESLRDLAGALVAGGQGSGVRGPGGQAVRAIRSSSRLSTVSQAHSVST